MEDLDPRYRILVLDDEYHIRTVITSELRAEGFDPSAAESGEAALQHIERYGLPHLAIVDIKLRRGMTGLEFCETVHAFSDLPIIMLSGIHEPDTVIKSIELYAEDYVRKPFQMRELLARVRRVLRRIGNFAYKLAPETEVDNTLSVSFQRQELMIDGKTISLTPTETKLLYILMRNAGRTTHSSFILRRMWPLEQASEDRLRVCVYRLRRKLQRDGSKQYIESQRGVGYRFVDAPGLKRTMRQSDEEDASRQLLTSD